MAFHYASLDQGTNRLIVFGGGDVTNGLSDPLSAYRNDVWVLTNANGLGGPPAWIQLLAHGTPGSPSPRLTWEGSTPGGIYVAAANRFVISGGMTNRCDTGDCGYSNEVWALSNANGMGGSPIWVKLALSGGPQASLSGVVYDSITDGMINYGGGTESAIAGLPPSPDTWLLTHVSTGSSDESPVLTQVNPNTGQQGQQNLSVNITGQFTHFAQGPTQASFGAGITINSVTVVSPTSLTANISIDSAANTGTRIVTVTTGAEVVSLTDGFVVTAASLPSISSVSPNAGPQGQDGPVVITGLNTHFVQGVSQLDMGARISVSSVSVSCATCLTAQVSIADNAPTGPHNVTVTTGTEVATLAGGFTVQPGTPILTSLVPASGQQGQSLSLAITGRFTHFAQGTTQVSLGSGIATNSVTVSNPTALSAQITIDPAATVGTRTLTVTTGTEVVFVNNVFTVNAAASNQAPMVNAGPDQRTALNANLLINPGNEANLVSGEIPDWTEVAGTTWTKAPAETAPFPLTIEGITYFYAGDVAAAELSQDVDVSAFAAGIAAGTQQFDFRGFVRTGNETPSDVAQIVIYFLDVTKTVVLGGLDSGPTPSPTAWTPLLAPSLTPPQGTAWLRVRLLATRNTGMSNDAYFDGISLRPVANAGAKLTGNATDDGLPTGSTLTSTWSKISGPGIVTFASQSQPQTSALFNAAGPYVLQLSASDTQLVTNATTTVTVNPPNQAPQVNAGPNQMITLPSTAALTGTVTDDGLPQGTLLFLWSKVDGPGTVTFNNRNALSTSASFSVAGAYRLRLMATDSDHFANAEVIITVRASGGVNLPPTAHAGPDLSVTLPNPVFINYTVTDDGLPLGGALTISWEMVSGPGTALFRDQTLTSITAGFDKPGTYVLRLTATDTQLTVTDDVTVNVAGAPNTFPTVTITSPTDGAVVTSPVTVVGTATSSALANWRLEWGREDIPTRTLLASGTTPILSGALGVFDPTLVLNGLSQLFLTATDTGGNSSTVVLNVTVDGNQKVGNFTVSFNDLTVPMAGIPIDIVRSYDSRDRRAGDFGVGWQLGLKSLKLQTTGTLGAGWVGTVSGGLIPTYCVQPPQSKVVAITMPEGKVFRFQPTLSIQCQPIVPPQSLTVRFGFAPLSGTTAQLAAEGNDQVLISGSFPGRVDLLDPNTFLAFNSQKFRLTLHDGRSIVLDQVTGIQSITDLNANKITFGPNGITHSAGKSVTFIRNGAGRITQITDPNGNPLTYDYDALGRLASFRDRENNLTTFTYTANGYLDTIRDPRGANPIRNIYDASGRLIKHIDAFGKEITYNHQIGSRQEIITDRLGKITVHEYDERGNVLLTTDALGGVTKRTYDSRDNLLTETDPINRTRTYTYDDADNRLSEKDDLGNTTSYTYNSYGQVLTVTDPLGRVTRNIYDAKGNLTSTRDPLLNITSYTYDSAGLRTSMTDPLNNLTQYFYDSAGNLTRQVDATGHATTYIYDANGNRTSQATTRTTSQGVETLVTAYQYDKENRLIRTTYPDGSTSRTVYNSIGKQSTTIDQLNRQTSYQYDELGRLTETAYPDGTRESTTYDAEGRRASSKDRGGRTTTYEYDALGRLTKTILADGFFTTTEYDFAGQVTATVDERSNKTQYQYDKAGRRTKVINALNETTSFGYDGAGNQTSTTDANSHTTEYVYDENNRRTRVIYPDTTFDQTDYDAMGRAIRKIDQAGKATSFHFDHLGRLTQVTDALNQNTRYAYDELGNRISQTDANIRTTLFEYDRLGRRTKRTLPLGMSETFVYDAAGNQTRKTDFNGKTTSYVYDAANRLTSKSPDPSLSEPIVSFTYFGTGQRSRMSDASGVTNYQYDQRDRLLQKSTPQGTLTYTYDSRGNLASIRSSNNNATSVDYTYDALNRLKTAKDNRLSPGITTYTYDAVGNLKNFVYPNGVQHAYNYDALNRLRDLAVTSGSAQLASYGYTLGSAGNRTKAAELGGRTVDYGYDNLYRLTRETITGALNTQQNGV